MRRDRHAYYGRLERTAVGEEALRGRVGTSTLVLPAPVAPDLAPQTPPAAVLASVRPVTIAERLIRRDVVENAGSAVGDWERTTSVVRARERCRWEDLPEFEVLGCASEQRPPMLQLRCGGEATSLSMWAPADDVADAIVAFVRGVAFRAARLAS